MMVVGISPRRKKLFPILSMLLSMFKMYIPRYPAEKKELFSRNRFKMYIPQGWLPERSPLLALPSLDARGAAPLPAPCQFNNWIELNFNWKLCHGFRFFFVLLWFYDLFCQVRALADIDEHVEEGHVYDIIVKVAFNTWPCHMWSIQLLQSCHNLLDNPSEGLKNPVKPKKAQQRLYWRQKTSFYDAKPQDIW